MIDIPKTNQNQEQAGEYQPIPSNLGSFMSSIANTQPVDEEPMPHPSSENMPMDDPEDSGGDGGMNWPPQDEDDDPSKKKVSKFAGRKCARLVDNAFASLASGYTHGKVSEYRKTKDELEELCEDFSNWMFETGTEISPTAALVMSILGMYVFSIPKLIEDRKRNLELEARQKSAEKTARRARNGEAEDVSTDTD